MRKKQWTKALDSLRKAEQLMPQVAGIRLNIGLAYFRQNDFLKAIDPFESVLRDQPDSAQARHLLGLCYFFTERWAEAADTLEPLWPQQSDQLPYLYVLSIAAHRAGKKDLDERATGATDQSGRRLSRISLVHGQSPPESRTVRFSPRDFQAAAEKNPKLTFLHFNLGLTYLKKQDYEHARDEFLRDAAVEPDVVNNYDELGDVYAILQQDADAEKNYREALRHDPSLINSYIGLTKFTSGKKNINRPSTAINDAGKLDPNRTDVHYLRGQVLLRMGRKDEGKKELETSIRIDNERRAARQQQVEAGTLPSPELLQDDQ